MAKSPQILDLDAAIKEWAWREYDKTATKNQRKIREKEVKKNTKYLNMEVDWSDVRFHDETKWPPLAQDSFQGAGEKKEDENENRGDMRAESGMAHCSVLFMTKFTNNTGYDQEYTLRTEKSTSSTATTEMETCYTKGFEMSIGFKSPGEVLEANAGYKREMSLTNSQGQEFEEELQWGVESQIKVKANHVAEAQLVVNEQKYRGDFTIESYIWGMVYVHFTNIRDNNSLVKATGHEISDIIKEYIARENRKGVTFSFVTIDEDSSRIKVLTHGNCKFRYGVRQEVKVDQKPL